MYSQVCDIITSPAPYIWLNKWPWTSAYLLSVDAAVPEIQEAADNSDGSSSDAIEDGSVEEMKLIAVTRNVKHLPFKNSAEVKVRPAVS